MGVCCVSNDPHSYLSHSEVEKSFLKSFLYWWTRGGKWFISLWKSALRLNFIIPFHWIISPSPIRDYIQWNRLPKIWERGFSEVRIILYTQLNFKYRRLIRNMQYLKGENIQRVCEAYTACIPNCKRWWSVSYEVFLLFCRRTFV